MRFGKGQPTQRVATARAARFTEASFSLAAPQQLPGFFWPIATMAPDDRQTSNGRDASVYCPEVQGININGDGSKRCTSSGAYAPNCTLQMNSMLAALLGACLTAA